MKTGLQRLPRPFFSPEDAGGSAGSGGNNPPAPPAGDPPTLPAPPPATPPAPASGSAPAPAPATRTRKPRAPKAPETPAPPPDTVVNIKPKAQNVVDKIEDLPTPGGLVLLLVIIALFLFAIVPVSGNKTRLRLLWDTVRGKTSLPEPTQANASSSSIANNILPGGIDNTPVGVPPSLSATGTGSPVGLDVSAAPSINATPSNVSGYDNFDSAYPESWAEAGYPQPYAGETVYEVPGFPEY